MAVVKKCISIPERVFVRAEKEAERLGLSRSEYYSQALDEYLRRQREKDVTEQINRVCEEVDTSLDPVFAAMQWASIEPEDWIFEEGSEKQGGKP